MKIKFLLLLLLLSYHHGKSCSFLADSFCSTIYSTHPDIIILRGYFSEDFENGSVFTILEVLRGEEEQVEIKVWDHLPFDCNGIIQRTTDQMGATNQEIVATFTKIDSVGFHDGEELGDYRVPEEIWWQSHRVFFRRWAGIRRRTAWCRPHTRTPQSYRRDHPDTRRRGHHIRLKNVTNHLSVTNHSAQPFNAHRNYTKSSQTPTRTSLAGISTAATHLGKTCAPACPCGRWSTH